MPSLTLLARFPRLKALLWCGFCTVGLVSAAPPMLPMGKAPPANDLTPTPMTKATPLPTLQADVVDQLLEQARATLRRTHDYTCTFIKQEKVHGRLLPEQIAIQHARLRPFALHMKFLSPNEIRGQQATYIPEKHGTTKMRVRPAGALGVVGFVTLSQTDPRVLEQTRHTMSEAGLVALVETLIREYNAEKRNGPPKIALAEYQFAGRPCYRVEMLHQPGVNPGYCHRCVIYFDKEHCLPIRFEAYEAPKANGPAEGELIECYSYVDLKLNVGLTDAAFPH